MLTLLGCSNDSFSPGKFVDKENPQNYTDLRSDGTFLINQGKFKGGGTYLVDGKRLTLTFSSGLVVEGKIKGNVITTDKGGRLTKQ